MTRNKLHFDIMKTISLPFIPMLAAVTPAAAAFNEDATIALLSSGADPEKKAIACRQLGIHGGPKSIPVLAALLSDEKLADYARTGLETSKDPAAGEALRKALPQLSGNLLIGAVTSLGERRENAAVPDLKQLVEDPKRGASAPAIAALGRIGTPESMAVVMKSLTAGPAEIRIPAAHASIAGAARLIKDGKREMLPEIAKALTADGMPDHIKAAAAKIR